MYIIQWTIQWKSVIHHYNKYSECDCSTDLNNYLEELLEFSYYVKSRYNKNFLFIPFRDETSQVCFTPHETKISWLVCDSTLAGKSMGILASLAATFVLQFDSFYFTTLNPLRGIEIECLRHKIIAVCRQWCIHAFTQHDENFLLFTQ